MERMRQQNLAKDAYKDEENAEMIRKFESLEIKDGKIILKLRAKSGEQSGEERKLPSKSSAPPPAGQPEAAPAGWRTAEDQGRTAPQPRRLSESLKSRSGTLRGN